MSGRLLFVDPCGRTREAFARLFRSRKFEVHLAHDSCSALYAARKNRPDWVAIEQALEDRYTDRAGIELVRELRKEHAGVTMVVCAAFASIDAGVEAIKAGALDYIPKPCSADEIILGLRGRRVACAAPKILSLERMKYEYALRAVAEHDGNMTHAAEALRVSLRTMRRMMTAAPPPL